MEDSAFQKKLADLVKEIDTLPTHQREKLNVLAAETKARHSQLKKTMANLQDSFDYLRLSIKYLMFDLEATRRENNMLRKMLEQSDGENAK